MSSVDEIVEAREAYQKALREFVVQPFFVSFFEKFPDVPAVYMRGWTPSFNDGDPCVHSQEVFLNPGQAWDWGLGETSWDELDGKPALQAIFAQAFGLDEAPAEGPIPEVLWDSPEGKRLHEMHKDAAKFLSSLDDVFENTWGTNWEVNVTRNLDGTVNVSRYGHYEDY